MIRDSRHMHGARVLATADEIRQAWQEHADRLAELGRGFQARDGEHGLVDTGDAVAAYVNESRWVADCPACGGGIAVWSEMADCCCYDCGRVYRAVFPPPRDVARAEAVLNARPESARNWRPDAEKVDDLKVENLVRGVPITAHTMTGGL